MYLDFFQTLFLNIEIPFFFDALHVVFSFDVMNFDKTAVLVNGLNFLGFSIGTIGLGLLENFGNGKV